MEPTYNIIGRVVSWAILLPLGLMLFMLCFWLLWTFISVALETSNWYSYFVRGKYVATRNLRILYKLVKSEHSKYYILLYRLRNINHIRKMHRK